MHSMQGLSVKYHTSFTIKRLLARKAIKAALSFESKVSLRFQDTYECFTLCVRTAQG